MARKKKIETTFSGANFIEEPQLYKLTLVLGDKTHESTGATVLEALRGLKKPDKIMSKGILTLEYNGMRSQQMYFPQRLKRLFYNPTFQVVHAKMLTTVGLKPV